MIASFSWRIYLIAIICISSGCIVQYGEYQIVVKNLSDEDIYEVEIDSDGSLSPGGHIVSGGTAVHMHPDFPPGRVIRVRWRTDEGGYHEESFKSGGINRTYFDGEVSIIIKGKNAEFEIINRKMKE